MNRFSNRRRYHVRTVQSVCAQLEEGIRYTNEHPGEQRDFTIDLT